MRVKAPLTPEDLELAEQVSIARFAPKGALGNIRALLTWLLALPITAIFLILAAGPRSGLLSQGEAVQWSLYVIYISIALGLLAQLVNWQIVKRHKFGAETLTVEFELTEKALVVTDPVSRLEILWQGISLVENDGRRIVVFVEPRGVFVIPDRCFERRTLFDSFHTEMLARRDGA